MPTPRMHWLSQRGRVIDLDQHAADAMDPLLDCLAGTEVVQARMRRVTIQRAWQARGRFATWRTLGGLADTVHTLRYGVYFATALLLALQFRAGIWWLLAASLVVVLLDVLGIDPLDGPTRRLADSATRRATRAAIFMHAWTGAHRVCTEASRVLANRSRLLPISRTSTVVVDPGHTTLGQLKRTDET